jgi:hypothetical protein
MEVVEFYMETIRSAKKQGIHGKQELSIKERFNADETLRPILLRLFYNCLIPLDF